MQGITKKLLLCTTPSFEALTGFTVYVYHREFWENPNGSYLEIVFYITLFLICAVIKWLAIPFFSMISLVLFPILFWKSCELLGQMNVFEHELFWFCKQSFFIYAAHIFPVEGLSSILSRINGNMVWVSFSYIVTPPIALAFLYMAARILNERFPKVYGLLCGNRI